MSYARQIEMAKSLITKFGGPATVVVLTTPSGSDEWNAGADVEQTNDCTAVFVKYAQKYVDGTNIQQGDQRVYIAGADLTLLPNLQGQIRRTVNGVVENWNIVQLNPLNPDGQSNILYIAQVR